MAYVYILESKRNGKYYIGSSMDYEARVKEHLSGKVYTTKRMLPIKLAFKQKYPTMHEAKQVERKLKSFKRHDILEKIIKDGVIKYQR